MNLKQLQCLIPDLILIHSEVSDSDIFLGISDAKEVKDKSIVFAKSSKYLEALKSCQMPSIAGLLLDQKTYDRNFEKFSEHFKLYRFIGVVDDVSLTLTRLSKIFYEKEVSDDNELLDGRQSGTAKVDPTAEIAQGVFLGKGVHVEAGAKIYSGSVIGSHSKIGANSVIYPNVTIYRNVVIGESCRIHSGSVIGADGFGFHFFQGVHHKIYHFGGVVIGDHVEMGANSCIDGGTFSPTIIGDGSKFDNHVQIGHNCVVGKGVIICGHVAIGGSTSIGDFTTFGGKSGTGHDLKLGAACQIAGGALVNCDWPDKSVVGGHPARPLKEWMRGLAYIRKESLKK